MRYLHPWICRDLQKKMVFLSGPRQVGKTTLAKLHLRQGGGLYLNWDSLPDQRRIRAQTWSDDDRLVIFDELHKFPKWKSWIKGVYDSEHEKDEFLVAGSARLDVYRRGGDSLLGRYHHWRLHRRLHPFTLSELPRGVIFKFRP